MKKLVKTHLVDGNLLFVLGLGNEQNLYFTVSQDVERGKAVYYIDKHTKKVYDSVGAEYGEPQDVIVATTDKSLINKRASGSQYPEWDYDTPQISQVDVEQYCKEPYDECYLEYGKDTFIHTSAMAFGSKVKGKLILNSANEVTVFLKEQQNMPIHIHEGITNTHVEIINGVIHVRPTTKNK